MTRIRDAVRDPGFAALVLLPAVLFSRVLAGGTFFFRDLYLFALPQRVKVAAALRTAALPLWDATLHAGQPLLSNPNNTALYPTTLLYTVLPPVSALNLEILLHVALSGAGTYLLARTLALSRVAAFVAGFVVAFSGPSLSLTNLLNRHLAAAWIPLVLLFWHRFLAERRTFWFAATALAFGIHILAGFPELTILAGVFLAVWTAVSDSSLRPGARSRTVVPLALLALALFAGMGVAAAQILPAARLLPQTIRGRGLDPASVLEWSVDVRRLAELGVPGLFGRVDGLSESVYLGRALEDGGYPYVLSLAFGAGTLALAAVGLRGSGELSPRQSRALGACAGASILLALGRHIPGVAALVGALPALALRFPEKLVAAAVLPVALLAGAGLDRTLRSGETRPLARVAGGAAALLGVLAALEAGVPGFARRFAESYLGLAPALVPTGAVARAFLAAALSAALAAVAAVAADRGWLRSAAVLASVAVALPLVGQAREVAPLAPRRLFEEPEAARTVRAAVGGGILFRAEPSVPSPVAAPSDDVAWLARRNRERLGKYIAAGLGIPVAFHYDFDGLAGLETRRVARLVQRLDWNSRVPVLAAAGVTAVLADEPVAATGLEREPAPDRMFLYRVAGARPAATLVTSDGVGPVETMATERPERRSFRTASDRPATLVLTTPFFEGWTARVDGSRAEVGRTNGYMQGVALPPGRHTIELSYWPPGLTAGLALSALTVGALVAAFATRRAVVSAPAS